MRSKVLPWMLVVAAVLGFLMPDPGRAALAWSLPFWGVGGWITASIFLISGWHLDLSSLRGQRWRASLAASIAVNQVLGIGLGLALMSLMPESLDPSLRLGLALMASMPTTLNTGIAIASAGRGDLSLAVLLTSTLVLCSLFTLPLALPFLARGLSGDALQPQALLLQLLSQVFAPLILGLGLRRFLRPQQWALWLPPFGVAASIYLAISRRQGPLPGPAWFAVALTCFVLLRSVLFFSAKRAARAMRLGPPQARSFVIVSSQKSVVLSTALLAQMPEAYAPFLGGAALFCVMYHLAQAFWDSMWAPKVAAPPPTGR